VTITLVEVEKLGRVHAVEPIVLSVSLNVPRSAAGRSGVSARVDELVISDLLPLPRGTYGPARRLHSGSAARLMHGQAGFR
jgi:hypothetical protein